MATPSAPIDSLSTIQPAAPAESVKTVIVQPLDTPAAEVMVPIAFFLVTFGIVLVQLSFKYRTRRLMQEERLRAMELRLPIPPEIRRSTGNPFVLPFLLIGLGLGLLVLWLNVGGDDRVVALAFGMISLLSGAGWFYAVHLNGPSTRHFEKLAAQESQAYVEAMARLQAETPATPPAPATPTPPSSTV